MAKQQIFFRRVETMPTKGLVKGTIYFDVASGTINVATSETAYDEFGYGVRNATWANQILTLTKSNGEEVTLNFSDVASADALAALTTTVNSNKTAADTGIKEAKDAAAAVATDLAEYETANDAAVQGVANDLSEYETSNDARVEAVEGSVGTLETTVSGHTTAIEALQGAVGEGGSVADAIDAKIADLDATVGSQTVNTGKHVAVEVVETDGKLTGLTVTESDIASAQGLADEITRATNADNEIKAKVGTPVGATDADGNSISEYSSAYTVGMDVKAAKDAADAAQADIDAFFAAAETGDAALDTLKEIQDFLNSDDGTVQTLIDKVSDNETAITNLQTQVGEGTVDSRIKAAKDAITGTLDEGDVATLAAINDELDALASADATNLEAANDYAKGLNDATEEKVSALNTWKSGLNVTDTAETGKYVSAVSQSDGKITVTHAALPDYTDVYDAKGAAAAAQTAAINAAAEDATEKADAAVISANSYTDTAIAAALVWAEFE